MERKEGSKNSLVKNIGLISIFIISIVVIGVSVSYAFYTASIGGSASIDENKAAILNIQSNLADTVNINSTRLAIIDSDEYLEKAEHIHFTVKNLNTSNVKGKYTLELIEMSLSKNLASKYFKWELVVNAGTAEETVFNGDFADSSIAPEGTSDVEEVSDLTKQLILGSEALVLDIDEQHTLDFYIWLENDKDVDQIYLTNGQFSGKLKLNAVPTR